jgi:hypothetical protein
MKSASSLRGLEPAHPGSTHSTAGRKTEYIDNAKFFVLNGSPVRQRDGERRPDVSPTKGGNRSSYLHTSEGIPVPPLDHLDSEYDFMHDLSQHSVLGEPFGASPSVSYAQTIGSSSSNSSGGSKKFGTGSHTAEAEKQRKQKRSSVFSSKTKASRKDGYKTDDSSVAPTGKDKKRKSYTFGSSFTKSKASTTDTQLLPVTDVKGGKTMMNAQRDPGDLPLALAVFLRDAVTFEMSIDKMKRLRFLLASESTR